MAGKSASRNERRPVVIRREEVVEAGHHGGAWKVAYADFVTAMMAFFLLMWLLNATTETQRKGLADYFTPANAFSHASSGSGQPFGGRTPLDDGSEVSDRGVQAVMVGTAPALPDPDAEPQPQATTPTAASGGPGGEADQRAPQGRSGAAPRPGARSAGGGQATAASASPARADYLAQAASGSAPRVDARAADPTRLADAALRAELERRERASFEQAAQAIRDAVRADPALADLGRQLSIDMTPEGLRIQLLDAERQPMFATGSSDLDERARLLLAKVAPVLAKLPESISIAGHTDAAPYHGGGKTNWELSTERANATRRLLVENGLDEGRFRSVTGNADRDPLLPAEPLAAANRRIAIVVLRAQGSDMTIGGMSGTGPAQVPPAAK